MRTFLVLVLSLFAAPLAFGQTPAPRSTIDATGTATVYVKPDKIYIGVGVETFDVAIDAATNANDSAIEKIVRAVRELGVEGKYIRTEELNVDVQYKDRYNASSGIQGYLARKILTVQVNSSGLAERVLSAALHSGANKVLGIRYDTSELRRYRDEARVSAAKAAREKAELLAGTLGATVGTPISIREGYASYYGNAYSSWNNAAYSISATQETPMLRQGGAEDSQVIPPGQMAVRADVYVTFELMPK